MVVFLVVALIVIGGVVFAMRETRPSDNQEVSTTPITGGVDSSTSSAGNTDSRDDDRGDDEEDDSDDRGTTSVPPVSGSGGSGQATTVSVYTMADVAVHSTKTSCWTVVNGSVYDVTSWISQHPGGAQAIVQLCGKDGTAKFTGQHGGQSQPESALASFKIGTIK